MPSKPRRSKPTRSLYTTLTGVEPGHVPKKWVKFLAGAFLLLPAWVLTLAFFNTLVRTADGGNFLGSPEFLWFAGGAVLGVAAYFSIKPLVWLYVIGHELTHAALVWLHGGKVHDFHVARTGGHIVTDKTNTLIVLGPYFVPFYTVLWIASYATARLALGLPAWPDLFQAGIGATWAFHLAFTVAMIVRGQPDLEYGGVFFSVVLIYLLNLGLICAMLVALTPAVDLPDFAREVLHQAQELSTQILRAIANAASLWPKRPS
jgi:hypothetical protein